MSMGGGIDFIEWLGPDMALQILMCLDDPSDFVRVSAVLSSWRHFVISHALCKQLCLRMYPLLSNLNHIIEMSKTNEPIMVERKNAIRWKGLVRDHNAYASLARCLISFMDLECIREAVGASSTDNYPEESIVNTLDPSDSGELRGSYWSSKGESDPSIPEKLVYKLASDLCVVTEVEVQAFQAYFQYGFPIYSAKAVRFRMGHPKFPLENNSLDDSGARMNSIDDMFVWTYTSPEFPMVHDNNLQKFKLPEPALCIGGYLQVELLGRVQKQDMDGLYYMCISYVQALGRPLSPAFNVDILNPSGNFALKYHSDKLKECLEPSKSPKGETSASSRLRTFGARLRQRGARGWEQIILNALLGTGVVVGDDEAEEEHLD